MNRVIIISLLIMFSGSLAAENKKTNAMKFSQSSIKIVGGPEAEPGAWPWMAILCYRGAGLSSSNNFCSGTLIHPKWVVTAAHCVENLYAGEIDVVMGIHNIKYDSGERIRVQRIIMNSNYDDYTFDSDIALLELAYESKYEGIQLISEIALLEGYLACVIGWGKLSEFGQSSDTLRQVSIPIVSTEKCQKVYPNDYISDNMLCAGMIEGGKDACQGDSGGPLMININNIWKIVGIVSWGEGCALPGFYGVYTKISSFINFIGQYVPITKISGRLSTNIASLENISVENASILIKGTNYTTKSDNNGFFYFYVPYGYYSINIQAKHFLETTININLSKRQEIDLSQKLDFLNGDIDGNGSLDILDVIIILQFLSK